jgi:hypothetical protein
MYAAERCELYVLVPPPLRLQQQQANRCAAPGARGGASCNTPWLSPWPPPASSGALRPPSGCWRCPPPPVLQSPSASAGQQAGLSAPPLCRFRQGKAATTPAAPTGTQAPRQVTDKAAPSRKSNRHAPRNGRGLGVRIKRMQIKGTRGAGGTSAQAGWADEVAYHANREDLPSTILHGVAYQTSREQLARCVLGPLRLCCRAAAPCRQGALRCGLLLQCARVCYILVWSKQLHVPISAKGGSSRCRRRPTTCRR